MRELKPGWASVKLGQVVRQVKDKVQNPHAAGITQYVSGNGIAAGDFRIQEWQSVDDGVMGPAFHMRFHRGHTLYKSRVPHGVAVADRTGICANTTFVLEANETVLLPELLPFLLLTESFRRFEIDNNHGSTNLFLNYSDIAQYEFALPPMDEQRRITKLLYAILDARSAMGDAANIAHQLSSAARNKLLIRQADDSASWSHPTLEDIALGKYGIVDGPFGSNLKTIHFRESGHPVISSSMFTRGRFEAEPTDYRFVDDEKFAELRRNRAHPGDILVVLIGVNCGVAAVLPEDHPPSVITQNCLKITVNPDVCLRDYLLIALQWLKETGRLERLVTSTQQRALSLGRLRQQRIPLPPRGEQQRIICAVEEVEQAERSIRHREAHLTKMLAQCASEHLLGELP
jgi:type I restriction enzyme S subunit